MTRRPNPFDLDAFQNSLREQGCAESFVAPVTSDFRLFVPVILEALGPERIVEMVNAARPKLGLGEQTSAWRTAAKYIYGWAEESLARYQES